MFFGGLDHYDFKILGKKEMYVPYNATGSAGGLWALGTAHVIRTICAMNSIASG
jgi:hypothetical protein